ncbi:MAG: tetratricopeptide repeat protein [Chloroflexi bacterium]|nr:tetratricopeptide repeat protein [Chloroflexota bacterium]
MATVAVAHQPELTPENALEVFSRHLDDRYDVHAASGFFEKWFSGRPHFVVRKTRWATEAVWLKQEGYATSFEFSGMQPPEFLVLAVPITVFAILFVILFAILSVILSVVGLGFPFSFRSANPIARILLRSGRKAIEADIALVIESASEFNPPGEEHSRRGLELRAKGKWQDAIREFDAAIELNPSHALAHAERGFAYGELGEANRAITDMERAIALTRDPDAIADLEAEIKELREPR